MNEENAAGLYFSFSFLSFLFLLNTHIKNEALNPKGKFHLSLQSFSLSFSLLPKKKKKNNKIKRKWKKEIDGTSTEDDF